MQTTVILTLSVVIFLAAFPLKNYLSLKKIKKDEKKWLEWLAERPTIEDYCQIHNFSLQAPQCDYCKNDRLMQNLEMVLPYEPQFGFMDLHISKYSYFKTYVCSQCGSQTYREQSIV